jgi:hypothetical protein
MKHVKERMDVLLEEFGPLMGKVVGDSPFARQLDDLGKTIVGSTQDIMVRSYQCFVVGGV